MNHRKTVIVVAIAQALTLGMGVSPAYAASTSSRLKSLEKSVKTLKNQITSIYTRLTALESRPTLAPSGVEGAKGDTGPAGPKGDTGATGAKGDKGDIGPTGPNAGAGFWPAEATQSVDPVVLLRAETIQSTNYWSIQCEINPTRSRTEWIGASEAYMKVTFQGTTTAVTGSSWYVNRETLAALPAVGTPIEVEYWMTMYGDQRHGHQTITGWTYTAY